MTNQQEPSYEELKRRLEAAESSLRAIQKAQGSQDRDESPSIVEQVTEAKAHEAHIKQVLLAIRDVNHLIVREHDRKRLLQGTCDLLTKTRGYHSAWIALFDTEQEIDMVLEAGFGASFSALRERLREGHKPPCMKRAIASAGNVVVQDPNQECTYCPIRKAQTALRGMSVVMNHEGRFYGTLCVALSPPFVTDEEEQALLQEIAGDLAFALRTIELEEARAQAVEELKASEETLRLIFENAFDGISIHEEIPETGGRRLIDCNKRYAEIAGRRKEDLFKAPTTTQLQQKGAPPRSAAENWRLREGNIPYRGTFSWIRPDDEENVIEYTAVPIELNGRPLTIGIDRDITEKVKAMTEREEALASLAESRRQLSTLMRNLPGMAYRCLNEPGRPMLFVSEGSRELTGYTPTEMTNPEDPRYGDLIHPADRQRVWDTIQEAVEAGVPYILEYRIRVKGGEERWVWERGRVVPQQDGDSVYLEGFISDITERKLAEEDLRLFKAIVENSNEAIAISDPKGMLVYINEAHATLFGRTLEEARQANYRNFYPPASVEILNREVVPALERGESWEGELDAYDASGRRFPLWERADSIRDAEGNLRLAFGLMHDVSEQREMEQALRASERQKAVILNAATEMIAYYDTDLRVIWANRTASESIDASSDDLVGRHCYEIWDYRSSSCLDCPVRKARESKRPEQCERQTPDGRYWHLRGYPVFDDDGEIAGLVEFGQDITERKQMELQREAMLEALRESEEKYRTLFEEALTPILLVDEGGHYVDANKAAFDFLDCEREELLGQTVWDFSPPDRIEQQQQEHAPFVERRTLETDYWVRGSIKTLLLNVFPLEMEGQTIIYGIGQDITERKEAEEERIRLADQIREQARQMAHILETVPAGVLLLDPEGRIEEANPVAENILSVLTEVETGNVLTRLGDRTLNELLTSPPTRGLWHEVKTKTPLGERTFEVIARPVENGPEPEEWVMVINEVTQEREIRAQLQRQEQLAAVGQLAAGIAHDFNNIMAVIVLYTQMGLRAPGLSSNIRTRLEVINQQAKRATDLIQQILDFGGRAILERRPIDLVPFLKETVRLLQRTIPEHVTINLTFGLDTYTIDGDPTRMQQMITNLVVNARDAMPNGGELRIKLDKLIVKSGQTPPMPEMQPGPWVKLTVSDSGVGMSDKVLAHLYEPFYTTKEPGVGTGLGLAQVHGIVSKHGGAIEVESEVDAGTTFTIYLPALETEAAEPAPQVAPPVSQGQGEVVLVVEDEPTVRAALVESLEAWHYQTMEAANGEEALAALDAHGHRIDVILSDVVMPVMGGIALFHAMRERGLSIPVVMLSGHPMESELKDLQAQGLAGWVLKPPDMKRLSQLLSQALQRDRSQ